MSFKLRLSCFSWTSMLFPFQMLAETICTPTPHCRQPYIWFHPPPEYQDIFCQRAGRRAHNSTYSYLTPCMQHMVNIHLTHPELKQIDHILPHKWDIILKNGTFDFLTRFKSTLNFFKIHFPLNSVKLGLVLAKAFLMTIEQNVCMFTLLSVNLLSEV